MTGFVLKTFETVTSAEYTIRGRLITSITLYLTAPEKSACNKEDIALCEPQPGQYKPVSVKNGHAGKK